MTKLVAYLQLRLAVQLDTEVDDTTLTPKAVMQAVQAGDEATAKITAMKAAVRAMPGVLFCEDDPLAITSMQQYEEAKAKAAEIDRRNALAAMPPVGGMQ